MTVSPIQDPQAGGAPRVVTVGETMALLHSESIGSLAHARTMTIGIGGAESNLAIGLRRLGVPVAWVSRVGADELGTRVLRELRAEQVEVRAVVDPERPTGLMLKSHPSGGATTVRYYRSGSAASALDAAALAGDDGNGLPDDLLAGAEILHLTGITPLLSDTAREAVLDLVERARAVGTLVSFDVNLRSALAPREVAAPLLACIAVAADIVFGGTDELALIADALAAEAQAAGESGDAGGDAARGGEDSLVRILHAHGIPEVVEKRGAEGARALAAGSVTGADATTLPDAEQAEAPGLSVDVVDTVGAGDAFVAGYLSARLEGLDLAARLARGNECGALICTTPGDWEGAAHREDLGRLAAGTKDPVVR
ncbi:sugar kinase [Brachybacterium halotolerans subsp. kimchii]|uniref:sugar kinase n=1 Tax=Brachybacterium halotolerans TaxID=2795215 RepID=UPI001E331BE3|nr:sugar kinase [Brachybacterium halotolerans]UEJ81590.1 sugar kinase [Brachybacterium halotolerans subsp. kimchii]